MDVTSSSPIPPPLVGRDRELALLHDRLTAARDGRGSLVLISGEVVVTEPDPMQTAGPPP